MRKGSLLKLIENDEPTASSPPTHGNAPTDLSQARSLNNFACQHSVTAGFYDYGEPISLSLSAAYSPASRHSQQEMAVPVTYAASQSYPAEDDNRSFYVEPFEAQPDPVASAEPESTLVPTHRTQLEQIQPDRAHPDEVQPNEDQSEEAQTDEAPPEAAYSEEPLEVTPTEVVPDDDEFESDLREILAGKKRYDDRKKQTVPAEVISSDTERGSRKQAESTEPTVPENAPKNDHAIFERIAQSMQHANAYDLGSVALDQRFDSFDREIDQKKKTA